MQEREIGDGASASRIEDPEPQRGDRLALALDLSELTLFEWTCSNGRVAWEGRSSSVTALLARVGGDPSRVAECIHPDDRAAVCAAVADAMQGAGALQIELRLLGEDGGVTW